MRSGTITDITCSGGKVRVTVNGETNTYTGSKGEIGKQGETIIDGIPVKPFDERKIPNSSFSLFPDGEKLEMVAKAAAAGYDLNFDAMGNMTFSTK